MSSAHYPRQPHMKSEQGGTRWYPAHKTLDSSTPNISLSCCAEPRKDSFLRHRTLGKKNNNNNILLLRISTKDLDLRSNKHNDATNPENEQGAML